MTINEMFDELENKVRDTYIVTLKYKYDFEENYTIENCVLDYDCMNDSYVWLNDWNEGQTDIEVLGYMPLGDVDTTKLLTCEDCISRQAVEKITWEEPSYTDALNVLTEVREKIRKLQPVTPQARVGHWIDEDTEQGALGFQYKRKRCSKCGWSHSLLIPKDYCPNCGADMRGDTK